MSAHSRWPLTTGVAQGRYYCIIALQLCTARPRTRGLPHCWCGGLLVIVGKRVQEVWEKKIKKGKQIIIINKKLTGKINMKKKKGKKNKIITHMHARFFFRNPFMLGNNFGSIWFYVQC